MKRLSIALIVLLGSYCTSSQAQLKPAYKADYSSSYTMGSQAQANIILDLWKDWDENMFDRHDYFADTVKMWMADSMVISGKATALEGAKKYRGSMTSCKSVIHAWVPLHSTDTGDDLVCVWGTETDTWAGGKTEVKQLHEVWWFNKAGKVSMMRQWKANFGQ